MSISLLYELVLIASCALTETTWSMSSDTSILAAAFVGTVTELTVVVFSFCLLIASKTMFSGLKTIVFWFC